LLWTSTLFSATLPARLGGGRCPFLVHFPENLTEGWWMMLKITKFLLIGAVFVGLSHVRPAVCKAWSLNPFASKEEKKDDTAYVFTSSTSSTTKSSGKSFWETIGISKPAKKPAYQSAIPRQRTNPSQQKKSKSWFDWGKSDEKEEKPGNVVDWLGKTERPKF
jgi:hypothetical protein